MYVSSKPFNPCNELQLTHKVFSDSLTRVTEQHMQKGDMTNAMLNKNKI